MKIVIPENIGEITLQQFQRYTELLNRDLEPYELLKRKINIFTGIKYNTLDNVSQKDFKEISQLIDIALNTKHEFVNKFELNGVKFGFIPNFDKIKAKEFVDFSLYPVNEIENLHKLMAILFRPIVKEDNKGNYIITDYRGTEDFAEVMKQMPMSIVDGALVFFYNLAKELQVSTQKYFNQELARVLKPATTL